MSLLHCTRVGLYPSAARAERREEFTHTTHTQNFTGPKKNVRGNWSKPERLKTHYRPKLLLRAEIPFLFQYLRPLPKILQMWIYC